MFSINLISLLHCSCSRFVMLVDGLLAPVLLSVFFLRGYLFTDYLLLPVDSIVLARGVLRNATLASGLRAGG